jgi:hypothetical protein
MVCYPHALRFHVTTSRVISICMFMVHKKPLDERYGRLTVIRRDGQNAIVNCDCGAVGLTKPCSDLRRGFVKSCGCLRRDSARSRVRAHIKPIELTYGRLTVIRRDRSKVFCDCACGNTNVIAMAADLRAGKRTSCGCIGPEHARTTLRDINTTHGRTKTTEYQIWVDMRRRCHQPDRPDYHRYGGRGISVCERWMNDFAAFYADMGPRPKGKTLERRDNDGSYSPDNCYWATKREQTLNTRQVIIVTVGGQRMTARDASLFISANPALVCNRLRLGWSIEDAVSKPPRQCKPRDARSP